MEREAVFKKLKGVIVEERVAIMNVDEVETVVKPDGKVRGRIPEPPTPFSAMLLRRVRPFGNWYIADQAFYPEKDLKANPEIEQPMPEHL